MESFYKLSGAPGSKDGRGVQFKGQQMWSVLNVSFITKSASTERLWRVANHELWLLRNTLFTTYFYFVFRNVCLQTLILMLSFSINSQDLAEVAAISVTADPTATHHILVHPPPPNPSKQLHTLLKF